MNQNQDLKIKALVVGSAALKHWYPDFPRIPSDRDIICTRETFDGIVGSWEGYDDHIEKIYGDRPDSKIIKFKNVGTPYEYLFTDDNKSLTFILDNYCDPSGYATPEVQYSIRKAHINFPIKFDKHIKDFMFLRGKLREKLGISMLQDLESDVDLLDSIPALTHLHFLETEKRLGKLKSPKMNQKTEDFFGKSQKFVKSYYVHDDMHKAVAEMHVGYPLYEDIIKDDSEVETDHEKWKQLPTQSKIWCVMEEVYVIALERKILPGLFEDDKKQWEPKEAFDWALMRVCTTLCDGFFREFAVRAYAIIQNQYNPNYVAEFFKNIQQYDRDQNKTEEISEEVSPVGDSTL